MCPVARRWQRTQHNAPDQLQLVALQGNTRRAGNTVAVTDPLEMHHVAPGLLPARTRLRRLPMDLIRRERGAPPFRPETCGGPACSI